MQKYVNGKKAWAVVVMAGLVGLSGCGGGTTTSVDDGSGGGTTPPVVLDYALQSSFSTMMATASKTTFTVSGTCSGTATFSSGTPALTVFESQAVYGVTQTMVSSYTNCSPTSVATTSNRYFDAQYNPLGSLTPGVEYGVYSGTVTGLPSTVRVGDTAIQATQKLYTDSTKATAAGQRIFSWVVEADANNSVIVNFITRKLDTKLVLVVTEQYRYRLDDAGTMTLISIDQQYADSTLAHYVYTAQ